MGEAFAEAWRLSPGAEITAVINEHQARLRVVGVAVSPEFAFTAGPRTGLPDPRHFGVVWMDEEALEKATGFVGAFNDVSLSLPAGADVEETTPSRRSGARSPTAVSARSRAPISPPPSSSSRRSGSCTSWQRRCRRYSSVSRCSC